MPPSQSKTSLKPFYRRFYGPFKWDIAWVFGFFTIQNTYGWASPILIGLLIDQATSDNPDTFWITTYCCLLIGMIIVNMPAALMRIRFQSKVTRAASHSLRHAIINHVQRLTLLHYNRSQIGRIQSKAIRDIEVIEQIPRQLIYMGMGATINILVAIIAIILRAPVMLIFFIILVPISVFVRRYFGRRLQESTRNYRNSFEAMSSGFYDMMTMIPVTRAHSLEQYELSKASKSLEAVLKKGREFDMISELFSASGWVSFTMTQSLFLIGAIFLCMEGHISVGDVVMFNTFFATISGSIAAIIGLIPILSQAGESAGSIMELLDMPDLEYNEGKQILSKFEGQITFENVTFQYPRKNQHAINDFSLEIKEGESIAFIGPSGAGKSTVLSLILGFVRPNSGRILVDGMDMQSLDLRSYRKNIGLVTQDVVFFSGSIVENVCYGLQEIDREKVIEALKIANAWNFVQKLPEGMDTLLGENGSKLSGGQLQRLTIARAVIRDPKLLILDEATGALDLQSEHQINEALMRVMKGRTSILVAHRFSLVKNCDRIVVVEDGNITHVGNHRQLMQSNNFYSETVNTTNAAIELN